ncbi:MAG: DNA-binding winged helix-turn-helix (wHTH) protein [Polaribacter sp.]|jgi:DNA-binding winged helix-turn-helix (wHTH) protein
MLLSSDKEVLDATLSNHIKIARAFLGDNGKAHSIIKR